MKYWKTASGEKIALNKLTDYHLDNIIIYLEKKALEYRHTMTYPNFTGEMAQDLAERLYEDIQDNFLSLLNGTIYEDLLEEKDRRISDETKRSI